MGVARCGIRPIDASGQVPVLATNSAKVSATASPRSGDIASRLRISSLLLELLAALRVVLVAALQQVLRQRIGVGDRAGPVSEPLGQPPQTSERRLCHRSTSCATSATLTPTTRSAYPSSCSRSTTPRRCRSRRRRPAPACPRGWPARRGPRPAWSTSPSPSSRGPPSGLSPGERATVVAEPRGVDAQHERAARGRGTRAGGPAPRRAR